MVIQEPSVCEMAGVYGDASSQEKYQDWVVLKEISTGVCISATTHGVTMSPSQARRLAQQLYKLARRVEKRQEVTNA